MKRSNIVTLPTPAQLAFKASCLKAGFYLSLTAPMIEALCAFAENTRPDRWWDYVRKNNHTGDALSVNALLKRGLIWDRAGTPEWEAELAPHHARARARFRPIAEEEPDLPSRYHLTPIGEALVQMLVAGGVYVQSDQAARRKVRRA